MCKAKSRAKECLRSLMEQNTRGSFEITKLMATENSTGKRVSFSKACGKITRWMVREKWSGRTGSTIGESIRTTRSTDKVLTHGKQADITRVAGIWGSSTEKECRWSMAKKQKGYGITDYYWNRNNDIGWIIWIVVKYLDGSYSLHRIQICYLLFLISLIVELTSLRFSVYKFISY